MGRASRTRPVSERRVGSGRLSTPPAALPQPRVADLKADRRPARYPSASVPEFARSLRVLALTATLAWAPSPGWASVDWLPAVQQRYAGGADGGQSLRNRFELGVEARLSGELRLTGKAYLAHDALDRLEPGQVRDLNRVGVSRRVALGAHGEAALEEFYLDVGLGRWDLRLGKQQVVWGESDGVKVLDLVNPQSFREGVLEPAEQSRIALWTAHAQRALGTRSTLEVLLLPDLSFHDIPQPDALFSISSPRLVPTRPPGAPAEVPSRLVRPALDFDSLEYGLRLRTALGRWEAGVLALRHHNDAPLQRLVVEAGGPRIERRYQLTYTLGAQASRPLGPLLVRGEAGYTHAAPLPALQLPGSTERVLAPLVAGLLALEIPVRGSGLVSLQYAQRDALTDARHAPIPDRQRFVTALWRDEWTSRGLTLELFTTYALEDRDVLLRLRLDRRINDALTLNFGGDLFDGDPRGVFGQHRALDRFLVGFTAYL